MKAIFEVEFDPMTMIDQQEMEDDFEGSWLNFMTWLYVENGMGIFDEDPILIEVKEN